jgi:hypothetical protein
MDVKNLFNIKERRDPESIKQWLLLEGFDEQIINEVITEFAKRIEAGEKFGYKGDISLLSIAIRERVIEVTKTEKGIQSFNEFSKEITGLKQAVRDLTQQYQRVNDIQSLSCTLSEKILQRLSGIEDKQECLGPMLGERFDNIEMRDVETRQILAEDKTTQLEEMSRVLNERILDLHTGMRDLFCMVKDIPTEATLSNETLTKISTAVWKSEFQWKFDTIADTIKITIQSIPDKLIDVLRKAIKEPGQQKKAKGFLGKLWR